MISIIFITMNFGSIGPTPSGPHLRLHVISGRRRQVATSSSITLGKKLGRLIN